MLVHYLRHHHGPLSLSAASRARSLSVLPPTTPSIGQRHPQSRGDEEVAVVERGRRRRDGRHVWRRWGLLCIMLGKNRVASQLQEALAAVTMAVADVQEAAAAAAAVATEAEEEAAGVQAARGGRDGDACDDARARGRRRGSHRQPVGRVARAHGRR